MSERKIGIRLCATCAQKREKKPTDDKKFKSWAYGFSATVLKVVFALWAVSIVFCMFVIGYALFTSGDIAEPVNFMHEINSTFGTTVVGVLITRVVGNVFEHNNGGIFGQSINEGGYENDSTDSNIPSDDLLGTDEPDYRSNKENVCG